MLEGRSTTPDISTWWGQDKTERATIILNMFDIDWKDQDENKLAEKRLELSFETASHQTSEITGAQHLHQDSNDFIPTVRKLVYDFGIVQKVVKAHGRR